MQMPVTDFSKLNKATQEGETVWLKEPLDIPGSGRKITKAQLKGHNLLINTIPIQTRNGPGTLQVGIPTGLLSIIVDLGDSQTTINIPTSDVKMITRNRDFPQVL